MSLLSSACLHYEVTNEVTIDLSYSEAWDKLGNIVTETLCFPSMFPCLPMSENNVAKTKFEFAPNLPDANMLQI